MRHHIHFNSGKASQVLKTKFYSVIQWTQHSVMGAFWTTILPIENLQGNCVPTVFQKIQLYPPGQGIDTVPLQIFSGQDSWPKGTHDNIEVRFAIFNTFLWPKLPYK